MKINITRSKLKESINSISYFFIKNKELYIDFDLELLEDSGLKFKNKRLFENKLNLLINRHHSLWYSNFELKDLLFLTKNRSEVEFDSDMSLEIDLSDATVIFLYQDFSKELYNLIIKYSINTNKISLLDFCNEQSDFNIRLMKSLKKRRQSNDDQYLDDLDDFDDDGDNYY